MQYWVFQYHRNWILQMVWNHSQRPKQSELKGELVQYENPRRHCIWFSRIPFSTDREQHFIDSWPHGHEVKYNLKVPKSIQKVWTLGTHQGNIFGCHKVHPQIISTYFNCSTTIFYLLPDKWMVFFCLVWFKRVLQSWIIFCPISQAVRSI